MPFFFPAREAGGVYSFVVRTAAVLRFLRPRTDSVSAEVFSPVNGWRFSFSELVADVSAVAAAVVEDCEDSSAVDVEGAAGSSTKTVNAREDDMDVRGVESWCG